MIRTTQPDDVRGWDAVFKYLRLPGCQNQFRCGISLGSLTHLGVRTVINPFPLTVRDRKDHERGYGNIGVLLHAFEHLRGTGKVAFLSNPSFRSRRKLLAKLCFGIGESKVSQAISLKRAKAGQIGLTWFWSLRPDLPDFLKLLHRGSFAVLKSVRIPGLKVDQPRDPTRMPTGE